MTDFVPNTLGQYAAMMKPKNREFSRSVRDKLYDGNGDKRSSKQPVEPIKKDLPEP